MQRKFNKLSQTCKFAREFKFKDHNGTKINFNSFYVHVLPFRGLVYGALN